MRILIRVLVALVILVAAYWGWALAGAAQLASAARSGDADALMERVDLQALIRSLASEISRFLAERDPRAGNPPPARRGVTLNGAAAEMLLRALLTPDVIAALLSQGRVAILDTNSKGSAALPSMPSLGEALDGRPWRVFMRSHFDGLRSFVVGLDSPDGLYRVHMTLSGLTWRLTGVEAPEPVMAKLAQLIATRIGGAVELPKD
jgi:hypothetical protein